MFDWNWRTVRQPIVVLIIAPIVAPIHIKNVHSIVSYQWAIYPKYDRSGHASPSAYVPSAFFLYDHCRRFIKQTWPSPFMKYSNLIALKAGSNGFL